MASVEELERREHGRILASLEAKLADHDLVLAENSGKLDLVVAWIRSQP